MRTTAVIALLFSLCGCAAGQQLASRTDDYEAYRRVRLAGSVEARLAESWRYLKLMPDGRFRAEVESWFTRNEPRYFELMYEDPTRLRSYLDLVPDGPRAQAVADRLAELELAIEFERRRNRSLTEEARSIEETLAEAQRLRRDLVQVFVGWTERLVRIRSWGQPTSALDHEFIYEFRLSAPRARCVGQRCTKMLSLPYAVPDVRRVEAREAVFDVVLLLDERGGIRSALITGPELFTRVAEAAEMRAIGPDQGLARAEAIARIAEIVKHALEPLLPEATCARDAVSPVVVERDCQGLRVRMTAAMNPEEEDRIEIEPTR
jgi:hypothetical protein